MKIANEVKVGILAVIALALLIWGYNFLLGNNVLTNNLVLKAEYRDITGLAISDPVKVHGLRVGAVTDLYFKEDNSGKVVAVLNLDKGLEVPEDAVAVIRSSIMGNAEIYLEFESSCRGQECLSTGAVIQGRSGSLIDDAITTVRPYLDRVDSLLQGLSNESNEKMLTDLGGTIANLKDLTGNLNTLTTQLTSSMVSSSKNLSEITRKLNQSYAQIDQVLANVDTLSSKLKSLDLRGLTEESKSAIHEFKGVATTLQGTILQADSALVYVRQVAQNLQEGDGILSRLVKDESFADTIEWTILNAQLLMQDLRLHPERYRTILSNKKKDYETYDPQADPARNPDWEAYLKARKKARRQAKKKADSGS